MTNTTELNSMTPRHRYFIFFNIGIQIVFPLSLSFTPSILAHATENRTKFLLLPETKVYTLGLGDTPAGIAKQQGITLEQLKKLNQFRTFSKPFEELSIGDEIDIPGGSEPVKTVGTEITGTETAGNSAGIAQTALQAGHFLQNNPGRDAAKDLARSVAVGEINTQTNNEVTEWLQGKGKARVKFDVDNDFTLKNSQLDILVPLWELPEHMVFSQASLHRTESRTQSNLGLGYRFFASEYMLGVNTFYDHDWSRSHSRVGLGAEYQRDFMKLSANGYFRTSDWKDSRDVQFYEERPADGWDLRAEGYLPAYPEIGGKLVYEKYYGDSVGLFGKDNQQKNPYAVTVGANYSPFPLLTFNAEQRQGKSGENDTRFGIDLNYTFGVPMLQQLDSHQLLASRLLQSNRYDFVDRNNHIILEYRKKETISVSLPAQVSGYTGEKRTLNLSVNSRHGVSHVEWSAPELLAHGGQITREGMTQYSVILPDYQYGKGAVNHYTVSVIAYDESGNPSRQASTQVLVTSAAVSPAGSILSPSEILLPNDGKSTEQLILKLQNTDNQPVTGVAADILMSVKSLSGSQSDVTVSKFTEATDNPGTYYATVTAGISSGEFLLTPKIQNISIASAKAIIGRAPAVSELMITGKLALGETLTGTYKFNANGSNNEDRSRYQWGNEGKTSSLNQSETVITSGSIPGYILVKEDIGKIKSLSLQARNALNTAGNTETVTTVPGSTGNGTDGGNNGSITDETGAPAISQVAISGTLSVGQTLRGSYTFDAQTGNPQDSSVAAWGERGSTEAAVSGGHGTATANGTLPDYVLKAADTGKVIAVSVQAKNGAGVTGNTETVTTAPGSTGNGTDGGNNGSITDEAGAPAVSQVAISGTLSVGQTLRGSYTFDAQTGNPQDSSVAAWGERGSTEAAVSGGHGTATANGTLPDYVLKAADTGKVIAVSVQAKNGAGVTGNTETVTTAPGSTGNGTDGGNNGSITDEAGKPAISQLAISGTLSVGQTLRGSYTFDAQTGNPQDSSVAAWGERGSTEAAVSGGHGTATANGTLPDYVLKATDTGKVIAVSVQAKNGAGVTGNTETVTTAPGSTGNGTDGGNNGSITDEAGAPAISQVAISGTLSVGQTLRGSYTFDAQTGNPKDSSMAAWGERGSTEAAVTGGNGTATANGTLPDYVLKATDTGKVIAVSVQAKNGAGVTGNTETVTTAPGSTGNGTDGGNNGSITDEAGAPAVSQVAISGTLSVGQALRGSYTFDAQTGNPQDSSVAAWGERGSTEAAVSGGHGTATANGTLPDYVLKAADSGKVIAVSVQAKNGAGVTGNTETVTTAPGSTGNGTDGGNNGSITDEAGAPAVSQVAISGTLSVGQTLRGSYTFDAQTGNPQDSSVAAWGERGSTEAAVSGGHGTATANGTLPDYVLKATDTGKVIAVSVQAKNGAGVTGNTETVTTAPGSTGNGTDGGNNGSITDEAGKPAISQLAISGTLSVGQTLRGSYTFDAQTGNPQDSSVAAWGERGSTEAAVSGGHGTATANGTLPDYVLKAADTGKVIAVSVQAKNGAGVTGNTETVTTAPGSTGNGTDGGNNGSITDEAGKPAISQLAISGTLSVGQTLRGSYTFDAQTGNPQDSSVAAWGERGSTEAAVTGGNGMATANGTLPDYVLKAADTGKVIAVSVQAKNGAGVTGNTETVTTAPGSTGNGTDGGNTDGSIIQYTFTLTPENLRLGETLQYQYVLEAKDITDGKKTIIPANSATWSASNNGIATIAATGILTAKAAGNTEVIAKGIYQNQPFEIKATLNVSPLIHSKLFGYAAGNSASVVVTPPDYTIAMRCAGIVDNMGGIGGNGGDLTTVKNVSNVSKIVTNTGRYAGHRVLSSITFYYAGGTSTKCGREDKGTVIVDSSEEYDIPDNYRLQGYKAFGDQYVNGVEYIIVEK